MNFGKLTTQPCATDPKPPDPRCLDDAFRLANPDICPFVPRLVIRPSFALACALGSVQFKASHFDANGIETDVTDQTVFQSSDMDIAVVGATSGNATGLQTGEASITGTYQELSATAELTVLGDNCCEDQNVAMMVMVDRTRSMKSMFGPGYATKLDFAKAAAQRFISEVNAQKDSVGLMQFTDAGYDILSSPVSNKTAVAAMVPGINQTQQLTTFYAALTAAITELNAMTSAELKVIVLISDGEDKDDSYSSADNPVALLQEFKDAGGIVLCIGVRAHDFGYNLLQAFSTGGFFLNGHSAVAQATLDFMSGLKGYICAGNCTPPGDVFAPTGTLNYCGFANWNVVEGHVDLVGNGFLDLLPGNGLYVDLAGSRSAYKGRMESKDSYGIEDGKTYRIKLRMAGNQRVDATPNTAQVRVFARNTDSIAAPTIAPTVGAATGSGVGVVETYEYAYSYVNANGETPLSPTAAGDNGGYATFSAAITATASGSATLVRFYKRETGASTWYRVAESDPDTPSFNDTLTLVGIAAAIAAGTIDPCDHPAEENTTGTPIVLFEQDITIDDFTQDFTDYNLSFDAPQDADVWVSIQQTETPAGYDATGLLLASVMFENVTGDLLPDEDTVIISGDAGFAGTYTRESADVLRKDADYYIALNAGVYTLYGLGIGAAYSCAEADFPAGPWVDDGGGGTIPTGVYGTHIVSPITLLEDDFDTEHTVYVPPACGIGTNYVAIPGAIGDPLVPVMTSNTDPSGVVTSGTVATAGANFWWAFYDAPDLAVEKWIGTCDFDTGAVANTEWVKYEFPAAQTVAAYSFNTHFSESEQEPPSGWYLEGSNDDAIWTVVDVRNDVIDWVYAVDKQFSISNPASFKYYRITFTQARSGVDTQFTISNLQLYGGSGSIYGYSIGYNCYGEGCLDEPPDVQTQDPSPVVDNETTNPPQIFTASADVVRSCAAGSAYVPDLPLEVATTTIAQCAGSGILRLDGLRWEIPVVETGNPFAGASVDPAIQTVVLHETSGTFDVTLRFRGIVERQSFTVSPFNGATPFVGTDSGFVLVPAIPQDTPALTGNEYYLFTAHPYRIYALNGISGAAPAANSYQIDYTVTIPLDANTTVALIALTRDNQSVKNIRSANNPNLHAPTSPNGLVPGIRNGGPVGVTLPDTIPFPGQFVQMDVVSITPQ